MYTVSESGEVENRYDYDIFGNPTLMIETYTEAIRYAVSKPMLLVPGTADSGGVPSDNIKSRGVQQTIIETTGSMTTTYTYNEQNRLISTTTHNGGQTEKETYDYDNNRNLVSKVKESTKSVDAGIVGSFKFYQMGTDTAKEAAEYRYDVWNQLTSTIEGDSKAHYSYNGEGLRVEKTVNDKVQRSLYEADQVVLEVDGSNNQIAKNTYGINLLSGEAGGQELYYMYNGHGDVTALIDAAGNTAATYYYDAFGNHTETTGEADNPYRYAGYQYDEETDLYYLNARYYDSKIARFMTEDTYRGEYNDPLSLNLYTYCNNEPIMYWDPTGHWQAGDENLPKWAQDEIKHQTNIYDDAKSQHDLESAKIAHDIADAIRDACSKEAQSSSSSSSGNKSKEKDTDKDRDKSGNSGNKSNAALDQIADTVQGMNIMQKYGYTGVASSLFDKAVVLGTNYLKSTDNIADSKISPTTYYASANSTQITFQMVYDDKTGKFQIVYNRNAAVAYATNPNYSSPDKNGDSFLNWLKHTRNHNPNYIRFDYYTYYLENPQALISGSSDCANFISQALYAGGISMTDEWYYKTTQDNIYIRGYTIQRTKVDFSGSWVRPDEQYNYFSNQQNGYINGNVISIKSVADMKYAVKNDDIQKGDIIFMQNGEGKIHHSMMVTDLKDDGTILFSGHSNDRINQPVSDGTFDGDNGAETMLILRLR